MINDLSDTSTDAAPTFLNIFPQNNETVILFSCFSKDVNKVPIYLVKEKKKKGIMDFHSDFFVFLIGIPNISAPSCIGNPDIA